MLGRSRGAGLLQVVLALIVAVALIWLAMKMFERARAPGSSSLPSPRAFLDSVELRITGMETHGDALSVQMALQHVSGVAGVQVDLTSGRARITYDPNRTSPDQFVAAVRQTGFQASR